VLVAQDPNELLARETAIAITIDRAGKTAFRGQTTLAELKRDPRELVEYLYRDNSFPQGALLLTGTGIVPGDDFTLATGDRIRITIDGIGTLENEVA
jgi:2-dehydro-3-deoxy-D-arabinonate dehydratase